jgi:hypothetical protein
VSQPFASSNGSALQAQTRRSTRIEKSIPLIILGQNRQGEPFMERTVSVSLNKHGCRYSSRHDYGVGTWVTLQVVGLINSDEKPVRALVRSVHPAASSRELQQVGVELETPSNIWGVVQPPKDWLREGEAISTIGPLAMPVRLSEEPTKIEEKASEVPTKSEPKKAEVANFPSPSLNASRNLSKKKPEGSVPQRVVVTPEGLLSAIQGKLQQEAAKAVHAAVGKEISQAVQEALRSIESARQSSVQRIEESIPKNTEAAATASKEEASAEIATQWKAELETYRGRTEEVTQRLEQQATELRRELATAQQYVEKLTREIQPQIPGRLTEAVTHASKEFDSAAAVIMDRRYERLRESVQVATQEALLKLNARSAELQAQVQSTMNSSLEEFRRETELHANLTLAETKDRATSALSSLDAENHAACDARRQALETELAQFAERATDQFHKGMNAFLHSCLVAAVSAIDEHSANTVIGLMKESAKAIEESSSASQTAEESTTLPDTGGNNSQVH